MYASGCCIAGTTPAPAGPRSWRPSLRTYRDSRSPPPRVFRPTCSSSRPRPHIQHVLKASRHRPVIFRREQQNRVRLRDLPPHPSPRRRLVLLQVLVIHRHIPMDKDIRAGNLIDKYDVIVMPDDSIAMITSSAAATIPRNIEPGSAQKASRR
jgi:hypothetical protein